MTKIEQIFKNHDKEMKEVRRQGESIKNEMVENAKKVISNFDFSKLIK